MRKSFIIKYLIENNISISFAESATGGSLASSLTKIKGSSKIFEGSLVTYSNESKTSLLGIDSSVILENGVVSEKVALEMIKGLNKIFNKDILVSVTGNAGPTTCDNKENVGVFYIGLKIYDNVICIKKTCDGSRKHNIKVVTNYIYNYIYSELQKRMLDI